jgi:hypothetical protein
MLSTNLFCRRVGFAQNIVADPNPYGVDQLAATATNRLG